VIKPKKPAEDKKGKKKRSLDEDLSTREHLEPEGQHQEVPAQGKSR
jgi:hypothetical protein